MSIPVKGKSKDEIIKILDEYKKDDVNWRDGKVFAYTFSAGLEADEVIKEAYMKFLSENGLDPTSFPSLARLDTEVVRFVCDLLRGGPDAVGNFTSGGTESIMLAIKTARDKAAAEKGITRPEMVVPQSAHSAFHKAAQYFGVKLVMTKCDDDFRANVDAMREAINENTIILVGSAPSYAQGVMDPIAEIGQLALKHDLLFHVDGCMGGIMLSFMREMEEFDIPDFDFTVPGVTSISADLHKFGYAAKGASVVVYRNKEIREHQIFATTATTAYAMFNATMLSSRSGGPMAGAWAIINYLGREGYEQIIREVMGGVKKLFEGINAIDGLYVLGNPIMSIFSFASKDINVFQLTDQMTKRGWHIQNQFSNENTPHNIHLTCMRTNIPRVEEFLKDLRECVEEVKNSDNKIDFKAVREQLENMLSSFGDDAVNQLLTIGGLDDNSSRIEEMAMISTILDALPKDVSKELLVKFVNNLYK